MCYFADLPGYGYAKMSKDKQRTIEVSLCRAVPEGCPFRPPSPSLAVVAADLRLLT